MELVCAMWFELVLGFINAHVCMWDQCMCLCMHKYVCACAYICVCMCLCVHKDVQACSCVSM